jgi:hypothetical protein
VERLNAFSKLVAAPKDLGHIDMAIARKRRKQARDKAVKRITSFKRLLTRARSTITGKPLSAWEDVESGDDSGGDGLEMNERKGLKKKKSKKELLSADSSANSKSFSSASTFASAESSVGDEEDGTGKKKKKKKRKKKKGEDEGDEEGDGEGDGEEQEKKEKFRPWDLINEGQPQPGHFFGNLFNYVLTTPLHLKRSQSKLEASKRMSSKNEIEYLSSTHGLSLNDGSAVCFEMMTWRRSALWILVIFGFANSYSSVKALMEAMRHYK